MQDLKIIPNWEYSNFLLKQLLKNEYQNFEFNFLKKVKNGQWAFNGIWTYGTSTYTEKSFISRKFAEFDILPLKIFNPFHEMSLKGVTIKLATTLRRHISVNFQRTDMRHHFLELSRADVF